MLAYDSVPYGQRNAVFESKCLQIHQITSLEVENPLLLDRAQVRDASRGVRPMDIGHGVSGNGVSFPAYGSVASAKSASQFHRV